MSDWQAGDVVILKSTGEVFARMPGDHVVNPWVCLNAEVDDGTAWFELSDYVDEHEPKLLVRDGEVIT